MASTRDDVADATGHRTYIAGRGAMRAWPAVGNTPDYNATTGVPANGKAGYAKACIWQNYLGGVGTMVYVNQGSNTSSSWVAIA